jgi:gentisate 1,2-dioxygenase
MKKKNQHKKKGSRRR